VTHQQQVFLYKWNEIVFVDKMLLVFLLLLPLLLLLLLLLLLSMHDVD